jgi:arylsulfatase A-like enzyme
MKIRCGLLLVIGVLCLRCEGGAQGDRPNLLLISVDTLRADHLGCYGYARDTSPTVDALAAEGVVFENAFSSSPKTTPSHMSIMTGLYPRAHNVYMWKRNGSGPYAGKSLSEKVPTLAEILRQHGYATAAFTGGANVAGKIGFGRGFEIYDEESDTEGACAWIRQNGGKRFFLFYHTYYTHDPSLPPSPYDTRYDPDYAGGIVPGPTLLRDLGIKEGEPWREVWDELSERFWKTVDVRNPRDIRHLNALYDGAIAYVDRDFIAALIAALRTAGVLDQTLIVFTSDHGEEFLEHGRLRHDSLYREVTHVPLILRLPGVLPAGKRIGGLARSIDILPTVLDLLNLPLPAPVQGISLIPAIRSGRDPGLAVYADFNDFAPPFVESVRTGEWFYLMDQRDYLTREGKKRTAPGFNGLFDSRRDPGEIADLAVSRPEEAIRLQTHLRSLRIESSRLHSERAAEQKVTTMDQENLNRLKALGYL